MEINCFSTVSFVTRGFMSQWWAVPSFIVQRFCLFYSMPAPICSLCSLFPAENQYIADGVSFLSCLVATDMVYKTTCNAKVRTKYRNVFYCRNWLIPFWCEFESDQSHVVILAQDVPVSSNGRSKERFKHENTNCYIHNQLEQISINLTKLKHHTLVQLCVLYI